MPKIEWHLTNRYSYSKPIFDEKLRDGDTEGAFVYCSKHGQFENFQTYWNHHERPFEPRYNKD